jgi:hypothetical protein
MNMLKTIVFLFIVTMLSLDTALFLNWAFLSILFKAMEKSRVLQR